MALLPCKPGAGCAAGPETSQERLHHPFEDAHPEIDSQPLPTSRSGRLQTHRTAEFGARCSWEGLPCLSSEPPGRMSELCLLWPCRGGLAASQETGCAGVKGSSALCAGFTEALAHKSSPLTALIPAMQAPSTLSGGCMGGWKQHDWKAVALKGSAHRGAMSTFGSETCRRCLGACATLNMPSLSGSRFNPKEKAKSGPWWWACVGCPVWLGQPVPLRSNPIQRPVGHGCGLSLERHSGCLLQGKGAAENNGISLTCQLLARGLQGESRTSCGRGRP